MRPMIPTFRLGVVVAAVVLAVVSLLLSGVGRFYARHNNEYASMISYVAGLSLGVTSIAFCALMVISFLLYGDDL